MHLAKKNVKLSRKQINFAQKHITLDQCVHSI
jgi:hypothetical protein